MKAFAGFEKANANEAVWDISGEESSESELTRTARRGDCPPHDARDEIEGAGASDVAAVVSLWWQLSAPELAAAVAQ